MCSNHNSIHMLMVADNLEGGKHLQIYFEQAGYNVTRLDGNDRGLSRLKPGQSFDVMVVDVVSLERFGRCLLHKLNRRGIEAPIVMIWSEGDPSQEQSLFSFNVKDYVTRPYTLETLSERVKQVLRQNNAQNSVYRFGEIEVDVKSHTTFVHGEQVHLTTLEFDVLHYFIKNRGQTVSRKQLLRDVWNIHTDITTRTIDRHVASLRKKIEPALDDNPYIETVYGVGYKLAI